MFEERDHIVFQPIYQLDNHTIYGYEALYRGKRSIESLFQSYPPIEVDQTIHDYICKHCDTVGIEPSQKIFFNCHPYSLDQIQIDPKLEKNIVVEITEYEKVNYENLKSRLREWSDRGIQIAIDDFGRGFNSVTVLQEFVPHYIKIDKFFIQHFEQSKEFIELLKLVCEERNIILVAEGIETREQYIQCVQVGIPMGQGYYLGVPNKKTVPLHVTSNKSFF